MNKLRMLLTLLMASVGLGLVRSAWRRRSGRIVLSGLAVVLAGLAAALAVPTNAWAGALAQAMVLQPGASLNVTCSTRIVVQWSDDRKAATITCVPLPTATSTRAATRTLAPTRTPLPPTATFTRPPATATRVPPTATFTAVPPTATNVRPTATFTAVPPTATPHHHHEPTATPGPSGGLAPVNPVILGTCPAEVHDRYVVTGPDGNPYRTWHPPTVPLDANNPNGPTCSFAHEHGDDPRTSLANPSLPPFGYINAMAGHEEAHEGFKVFVANRGTVNDEGRDAKTSSRIVFHMGTGGVKRFTEQHHSLMFDLVAPSGHYVRVQGMADTKLAGSICERDRTLSDNDPDNDIGRTVVLVKGAGCDLGSLYEIWGISLNIADRAIVNVATAAFDPITVMNPADRTQLILTSSQYPGEYFGCDRESYHGPVYWYNANGPTVYYTDAHGNLTSNGGLRQEISNHSDIGIPMSPDQTQFKIYRPQCVPGLGLKN